MSASYLDISRPSRRFDHGLNDKGASTRNVSEQPPLFAASHPIDSEAAWRGRTTIVATRKAARIPSRTRKHAPPCCKMAQVWLRVAQSHDARRKPIRTAIESLSSSAPWRVSPKPAPFPPTCDGAARSLPAGPSGDIPPRSAGIALRVPCRSNRPTPCPFRRHGRLWDGTDCALGTPTRSAAGQIKAPPSGQGGALEPAATPGEEMRPRSAASIHLRAAGSASVSAVFIATGNTLFAF